MASGDDVLYVWEGGMGIPWSPSNLHGKVVTKVSFGEGHYAILTGDGQLFVAGKNDCGQLGNGTQEDQIVSDAQLLNIKPHSLIDVCCGHSHTAVVTTEGLVFCWGDNGEHQCGPGDDPFYSLPSLIPLNALDKMCRVACGKSHTIAISESNELWTWGSGFQLGLGISKVAAKPRKVEFLCGRRVIGVACGDSHTVALVARSQELKGSKSDDRRSIGFIAQTAAADAKKGSKLMNRISGKLLDGSSQEIDREKKTATKASSDQSEKSTLTVRNSLTDASEIKSVVENVARNLKLRTKGDKDHLTLLRLSEVRASPGNEGGKEAETSFGRDSEPRDSDDVNSPHSPLTPHSPNTFLNEAEAKEFLQKQMYGDIDDPLGVMASKSDSRRVEKKDSLDMIPLSSPFTKTVENLLQHVPSSPVVVQEYVTNLTKAVVSNIRISVMDRFSFSSSQADLSQTANTTTDPAIEDDEIASSVDMKLFSDNLLPGGSIGRMLPKSTSMGLGNVLKQQTHHRNGSLPTSALHALCQLTVKTGPKLQLDTEVWTWGCGSSGQLGHGDLLDRCHPCVIQSLNQCHIVKVIAGSLHTVALSANSQIYVWGDNTFGQLGHRSSTTCFPLLISVFGNLPAWDVSAGVRHTLVLYDTLVHKPRIYFCGSEPHFSDSNQPSVSQLTAVVSTKDIGLVHSVVAGHLFSSCVISHSSDESLDSAIYELASNERFFHATLDRIYQVFMKPILSQNTEAISGRSELILTLQNLFEAFENVIRLISTNHIELSLVLRGALGLLHVQSLHDYDHCIAVYQKYFRHFNDVLAWGGFEKCVRTNKEFFDKVKTEFSSILEDSKVNLNDLGLSLHHLFYLPFERPRQYQKLLGTIASHYPVYSNEEMRLQKVMLVWDRLRLTSTSEHRSSENTVAFWKTVTPKLAESLQVIGRRLVRESRKTGLALASAGRFSSHSFFLFNDCFVHLQNSFPTLHRLATVWIEVLPDSKQLKNAINLITPEDTLTLTAPSHSDKAEWVWAFNQTILQALIAEKNLEISSSSIAMVPPRDRHASYVFTKPGNLKDTRYTGMWRNGKIHGYGELLWPDGRRCIGQFLDGQFEGCGVYTTPKDDGTAEVSEGWWKAGQLHGYGVIRYSNGDVYKGHFAEGRRHGHGCMKQGKFTATTASLYNGQWKNDKRSGYGVCHDITKGNKYMGMWLDDSRHGSGIIVTLDGLYFEGNFSYGKMTGAGLLVTDDGCWYEGEFFGGTSLCGKGTLTMPNGDYIEGQFNGSFTEGVKINGTFYKNCDPSDGKKPLVQETINPKSFGKLCAPASSKWEEIFAHCYSVLGCTEGQTPDSERAWSRMASIIASCSGAPLSNSRSKIKVNVDDLERIPDPLISGSELTFELYRSVKAYLSKAFDTVIHPLGQLMASLVDVYLATYVGVGAHMRLLYHAVQELKAYVAKIYPIVRLLFPLLPLEDGPLQLSAKSLFNGTDAGAANGSDAGHMTDSYDLANSEVEIVTADSLLFPFLLPKIYPPLFSLYALYNEKEDDRYWKRVRLWNKQSNLALMAYLGVDRKFWLSNDETMQAFASNILSGVQEDNYIDAIDRLQRISTSFTPTEKLSQIQLTFGDITKLVQSHVGRCYQWSMDELFPVFHYVVVRARIQHLGAEIHFIEDLIERHLENGQLGIMFTTLKACYYQILNEKVI